MIKYETIQRAKFISRPNRFIAQVLIDGSEETVHVKNTGRCKELLVEGSDVILFKSDNPQRKTRYDLIAVYKQRENAPPLLINLDSQIPNDVAVEWLKNSDIFSKNATIRREVTFGSSRFDIYVEDDKRKAFVEVKGVTLENDGIAAFPDAPTERGIKHVNELIKATACGYEAYILFVIQMDGISEFRPNDNTHKAFGNALRDAVKRGVRVIAIDCIVNEDSIEGNDFISVVL